MPGRFWPPWCTNCSLVFRWLMVGCYHSQAPTENEVLRKRECQDHSMLIANPRGFTVGPFSSVRICRTIQCDQHLWLELLPWLAEAETKWGKGGSFTFFDFTICHRNFADSKPFNWEQMYITFPEAERCCPDWSMVQGSRLALHQHPLRVRGELASKPIELRERRVSGGQVRLLLLCRYVSRPVSRIT